ncbi:dual specificity phosphatase [Gordonia phage Yvonnetastic]|uniref:Dual specificity protein-tyrosine phosphatase n=1 Tax=Gordonia phage Yvonnetastic TaxID=1821566 RepID=A0A142K982_9CAUD|nr:dual specificity phosphatase [Gordonia phage Yvonnetastic]AMS02665.1 dual specificity protein-tyrosine phosphatase [Gordonia phage Yvonnetastic]
MSTDETRIDIAFDPREQRMHGWTAHHGIEFDVPYMTEIVPGLWQGGCRDGLVLPTNIDHLVSLYPWESYTVGHELKSKLEVRMKDSLSQTFEQVEVLADWVNSCRKTGQVLVHCQAGLNRSSLVVAAALLAEEGHGYSPEQVVTMIRTMRSPACLCNSAFEEWLMSRGCA